MLVNYETELDAFRVTQFRLQKQFDDVLNWFR